MSSAEFTEYMAYYVLEPFGAWRDNWHAAQLTALMYNVNAGKGKSVSVDEFMYHDSVAAQDKKDMEMLAKLNAVGVKKHGN